MGHLRNKEAEIGDIAASTRGWDKEQKEVGQYYLRNTQPRESREKENCCQFYHY